jgi:L-asparagine oxygenase
VGADLASPQTAAVLAETAGALARAGATPDDLFVTHLDRVPDEPALALRELVRPPDRTTGWRLVRELLAGFDDLGPTPASWAVAQPERNAALDLALVLVAASMGPVFGWAGQQGGRLVHNIVPTEGYEGLQVGASSSTPLYWHTEDAFHPARAQLLVLASVRNHDEIGSNVASIRRAGLSADKLDQLRRPQLAIVPDDSYPGGWEGEVTGIPTVWDGPDGGCLRYDPSYTRFLDDDPDFRAAYDALGGELDRCGETLPMRAGDIAIIDNDVAVHGRIPFRPRYDGTDRWLKRVLVRLPRGRPEHERLESGYAQELVTPRWLGR